jgi:hypothetical protein
VKRLLVLLFSFALAFSPTISEAYSPQVRAAVLNFKPSGTLYVGPGDISPGAWAGGGLRAYARATIGSRVANICNAGDANCADVNTTSLGDFNVVAAQSAPLNCGGAGGTCTVKTLYDKTGNTNCTTACDFSNATAANRPTLVFNDTAAGKACMRFNGSSQFLATPGSTPNQPFTFSSYAIATGNFTSTTSIAGFANTFDQVIIGHINPDTLVMYDASAQPTATAVDNVFHAIQSIFDNTGGSSIYIDGVSTLMNLLSGVGGNGSPITLGSAKSASLFWTGDICEISLSPSAFNPSTQAAMNTNQTNYYVLGLYAGGALPFDPNNPTSSGFGLAFNDEFNSLSTIDVNNTQAPGFNWYVNKFFGFATSPASAFSVSGGVLTIAPTAGDVSTWQMASAAPSASSPFYNGRAFFGGTQTYIEASLSFDDSGGTQNVAFWSMALAHGLGTSNDQWPGQAAGYEHFGENDFYEYLTNTTINSSLHDWYGVYNVTCSPGSGLYCQVQNANNVTTVGTTNWTTFHRFGQLYMPGGYLQNYLDGVPTSSYNFWIAQALTPPPSTTTKTAFSILDTLPNFVILGTGIGQTLKVDYVRVWQKSETLPVANDNDLYRANFGRRFKLIG